LKDARYEKPEVNSILLITDLRKWERSVLFNHAPGF